MVQAKTPSEIQSTKMPFWEVKAKCVDGNFSKFYHEFWNNEMFECMCIAKNKKETELRIIFEAKQEAESKAIQNC